MLYAIKFKSKDEPETLYVWDTYGMGVKMAFEDINAAYRYVEQHNSYDFQVWELPEGSSYKLSFA